MDKGHITVEKKQNNIHKDIIKVNWDRERETESEKEKELMNYENLGTLYFLVMENHDQSLQGASVGLHWVYQRAIFSEHLVHVRLCPKCCIYILI